MEEKRRLKLAAKGGEREGKNEVTGTCSFRPDPAAESVLMIDQEKDSQQKKQRNNAGTHLYTE